MNQDSLYEQAAESHGAALDRLARAYEFDPEARRDLLQEIHLQLWRSFAQFDGRCSFRIWLYRVAHNVAARYVSRQRRVRERLVSIENIETLPELRQDGSAHDPGEALDRRSDSECQHRNYAREPNGERRPNASKRGWRLVSASL